jgi:hypothetical protein
MWPFNRGWPLNGGPLNRGSTVHGEKYVPVANTSLSRVPNTPDYQFL